MKYSFVDESWEDYTYWVSTDKKTIKKSLKILRDFGGTGGSRTRVQTRKQYAFYMLSPDLIVG